MVDNIRGTLDAGMLAAGLNATVPADPAYIARAAENGVYNATASDSASLSRGFTQRGQLSIEEDNGSYIYNIKQYDVAGKVNSDNDSYYLVSYNGESSFVDAAFGYSDLSSGYNSVDTYIDPFDPEISKLLTQIPELDNPKLSAEEKLTKLYNYIIDNFNYVPEDKDDWNFVGETIFQRGGDCEDLSILLASAMIALLMNEGMDYQTANSRVSAVAGKHAVYGDHVFVEYLADDGQTYALDAAFAEQGNIAKLSDLKQVNELSFDVYFRFNDNKVFGTAAQLEFLENNAKAYIDPTDPALSKFLAEFEGAMDLSGLSMDEITAKLFNYIKTEYQCLDLQDVFPNQSLVIDTKAGASQNLALLAVNSLLALAAKTGASLPNARVCEATDKASGEKQWVMLYQDSSGVDRVFDFSDKIVSPQLQLGLVKTADDLLSINSYVPVNALSLSADFGQEYSISNNLYSRSVQRFNPKAGYVSEGTSSTYGKLSQPDTKLISDFYANNIIFGSTAIYEKGAWSGDASPEDVKSVLKKLKSNGNDGNSIDSILNNRTDVWGVNQRKTQTEITTMTNIGNFIDDRSDFWRYEDDKFEKARVEFLFQRNILAFLAMVMEAQNEAYNIVGAELERVGSEEAYKSMKASQIIQTETDTLLKDVNELKKEAVGIVNQHNQLMESVISKEIDEIQKDRNRVLSMIAAVSSVAFAAAGVTGIGVFGAMQATGRATMAASAWAGWAIPGVIVLGIGMAVAIPLVAKVTYDAVGRSRGNKKDLMALQIPAAIAAASVAAAIPVLAATIIASAAGIAMTAASLGTAAPLAAAGVAFCIGAGLALSGFFLNTILGKLSALISGTITLEQDQNKAEAAQEKWDKVSKPKAEVAGKNLAQTQSSAKDLASSRTQTYTEVLKHFSDSGSAQAIAANMQMQYSLLDEAAKVKFKRGADGLIYDNDEKFIVLEREISRLQIINRTLGSLHAAKAQSRNAVHTEMTSQSGYTTSTLVSSLIEQEQSVIMEKFNEIKQLRQEYISAYNASLSAAANADKLTKLFQLESTAFGIGFLCSFIEVPMDPQSAIGIVKTLFNAKESVWDRDDLRREFDMTGVVNGSESGYGYSGGSFGSMTGAGDYAIAGEVDVLKILQDEWNKGVHVGLTNREISKYDVIDKSGSLWGNPANLIGNIVGGGGIFDWLLNILAPTNNVENQVKSSVNVNSNTQNIADVSEADGLTKSTIDVAKDNYQMTYRARIAWMRYQATQAVNLRRAQFMIQRYNLESRNIVHQEMTNTTTYQVSGLAEQALSAEFQYVTSIIAAYAQREEQRIQTRNAMIEREQQRWKQAWVSMAGPFGYLVGPKCDELLAKSYANMGQPDATSLHSLTNGIGQANAEKLNEAGTRLYNSQGEIKSTSKGVNVYTDSVLYSESENGLIVKTEVPAGIFGGVASYSVNFENMNKAQADIYGLSYLNAIWQAMYNTRSASRSMVHQVLTNVSNLSLSNYSGGAVGAENQFIQSKAQDLTSTVNDIVSIKQKIYDAQSAQKNEEVKRTFGIIGTIVAAVAIVVLIVLGIIPQLGTCFSLMSGVSGLAMAVCSFFEAIVTMVKLAILKYKQQEELKDITKKAREKARQDVDGKGSGDLVQQTTGDTDPLEGTNSDFFGLMTNGGAAKFQLSLMQANMKKMERINAALRKVHRAKGEARGKITSKISGAAGANLPSAAEMVAGLEAGVAGAMLEQLVSKASKLEETDKKIDTQIDKIISATAGLTSATIAAVRAAGDFKDGIEKNLEKYGGNAWKQKGSQLLQEIGDFFKTGKDMQGKNGANSFWQSKAGKSISGVVGLGTSAVGGQNKDTKGLNTTGTGGFMGMGGGGGDLGAFNKARGESRGELEAQIKSKDPNIAVDSAGNIDPAALSKYVKEHPNDPDVKAFGEATAAAADNYLQSEAGMLKGLTGAVVGLAFAWLKLGAALLTGDLLDWGTSYSKHPGANAIDAKGELQKPEATTVEGATLDDTVIDQLKQGDPDQITTRFKDGNPRTGTQVTNKLEVSVKTAVKNVGDQAGGNEVEIKLDGKLVAFNDLTEEQQKAVINAMQAQIYVNNTHRGGQAVGAWGENGVAAMAEQRLDALLADMGVSKDNPNYAAYRETLKKNSTLHVTEGNMKKDMKFTTAGGLETTVETDYQARGNEDVAKNIVAQDTGWGNVVASDIRDNDGEIYQGYKGTESSAKVTENMAGAYDYGGGLSYDNGTWSGAQANDDGTITADGVTYRVEENGDGPPILQEVVTDQDELETLAGQLGINDVSRLQNKTPTELNDMIAAKNGDTAAAMDTSNLEAQKAAIADLIANGVTIAEDAPVEKIRQAIDAKNGDIAAKNADIIKELQGKGLNIPDNATQKQIDDAVDAENTRRQGVTGDANAVNRAESQEQLAAPISLSNGVTMQITADGQVQISKTGEDGEVVTMTSKPEEADKIQRALDEGNKISIAVEGPDGANGMVEIGRSGSGATGGRKVEFSGVESTAAPDDDESEKRIDNDLTTADLLVKALADLAKNILEQANYQTQMDKLSGGAHVGNLLAALDPRDAREVMSVLTDAYAGEGARRIQNDAEMVQSMQDLLGKHTSPGTLNARFNKFLKEMEQANDLKKNKEKKEQYQPIQDFYVNNTFVDDKTKDTIAFMISNGQEDEARQVMKKITAMQKDVETFMIGDLGKEDAEIVRQNAKDWFTANIDSQGTITVVLKQEVKEQLINGQIPSVSTNAKLSEAIVKKLKTVANSDEDGGVNRFTVNAGEPFRENYNGIYTPDWHLGSNARTRNLGLKSGSVKVDGKEIKYSIDKDGNYFLPPKADNTEYSDAELRAIADQEIENNPGKDVKILCQKPGAVDPTEYTFNAGGSIAHDLSRSELEGSRLQTLSDFQAYSNVMEAYNVDYDPANITDVSDRYCLYKQDDLSRLPGLSATTPQGGSEGCSLARIDLDKVNADGAALLTATGNSNRSIITTGVGKTPTRYDHKTNAAYQPTAKNMLAQLDAEIKELEQKDDPVSQSRLKEAKDIRDELKNAQASRNNEEVDRLVNGYYTDTVDQVFAADSNLEHAQNLQKAEGDITVARGKIADADRIIEAAPGQIEAAEGEIAAASGKIETATTARDEAAGRVREKAAELSTARQEAATARSEATAARNTAIAARKAAVSARKTAVEANGEALQIRKDATETRNEASETRDKAIEKRGEAAPARRAADQKDGEATAKILEASGARTMADTAKAKALTSRGAANTAAETAARSRRAADVAARDAAAAKRTWETDADKADRKRTEANNARGFIDGLKERITDLQARLVEGLSEAEKTEIDTAITELEDKILELEPGAAALETAAAGLEGDATESKKKYDELQGTAETLEGTAKTDEATADTLETTAKTDKAEANRLDGIADGLETEAKELETEAKRLKGIAEKLEEEVERLEEQATELEEKARGLEKDAIEAEEKAGYLNQEAEMLSNTATGLEEAADGLEDRASDLEATARDLEKKVRDLEIELEAAKADLAQAQADLAQAQADLEEAQEKKRQLEKDLDAAIRAKAQAQAELTDALRAKERAEEAIKATNTQLSRTLEAQREAEAAAEARQQAQKEEDEGTISAETAVQAEAVEAKTDQQVANSAETQPDWAALARQEVGDSMAKMNSLEDRVQQFGDPLNVGWMGSGPNATEAALKIITKNIEADPERSQLTVNGQLTLYSYYNRTVNSLTSIMNPESDPVAWEQTQRAYATNQGIGASLEKEIDKVEHDTGLRMPLTSDTKLSEMYAVAGGLPDLDNEDDPAVKKNFAKTAGKIGTALRITIDKFSYQKQQEGEEFSSENEAILQNAVNLDAQLLTDETRQYELGSIQYQEAIKRHTANCGHYIWSSSSSTANRGEAIGFVVRSMENLPEEVKREISCGENGLGLPDTVSTGSILDDDTVEAVSKNIDDRFKIEKEPPQSKALLEAYANIRSLEQARTTNAFVNLDLIDKYPDLFTAEGLIALLKEITRKAQLEGIDPRSTDQYKMYSAIIDIILYAPDDALMEKLNLTPEGLEDLRSRIKETQKTVEGIIDEIPELGNPDFSQHINIAAGTGNKLNFMARVQLLSSDFDAVGALLANRREDKKLAERINNMREVTSASAGQVLKQALANSNVGRIAHANIIAAQNDLSKAVTGGNLDQVRAAASHYKNTLIEAGLLSDEDVTNFDAMQQAFEDILQGTIKWDEKLFGKMPEGLVPDGQDQRDMLAGIFTVRSIKLLTTPPILSFHETAIEQNFSANDVGDMSMERSKELFARCLVGQAFTMDPAAARNNSLRLVDPVTYKRLTEQVSAYAMAVTAEDRAKIRENIAEIADITIDSPELNLLFSDEEGSAYQDFAKLTRDMLAAQNTRKHYRDDNTNRRNWHSALRTHFYSQLNDTTTINNLRRIDNAMTEYNRGRSSLLGPAGNRALEANEQMRAEVFRKEVIIPMTERQSSVTQMSTDYRRDMTNALTNLCNAGEPTRDVTREDIDLGRQISTEGKIELYNTAPSWTLETDILGLKDAAGTTLQPGMLDNIRNMPRGNTATIEQNKDCLNVILNTREVLLDETNGQPLSPELRAALDELNQMGAQTTRDLRKMGYGYTPQGEEKLTDLLAESRRQDDEQEHDPAAAAYQDAMKVFLREKNPAISLDGGTQLCGADGKLPDVIANTGEEFNGVVGADGTNRTELGKVLGGDNNAGINDAMKTIFFVAASGGEPPVIIHSGGLTPEIVQPKVVGFESAFAGDSTELNSAKRAELIQKIVGNAETSGIKVLLRPDGTPDVSATLTSLGDITMPVYVNLTNTDGSFADKPDPASIMNGRVFTMLEVLKEALGKALGEGAEEDINKHLFGDGETAGHLQIDAQYTFGNEKLGKDFYWSGNAPHDWTPGGDMYQKAIGFITEQNKKTNDAKLTVADPNGTGITYTLLLRDENGQPNISSRQWQNGDAVNKKVDGRIGANQGLRAANISFNQSIEVSSWNVSGDINGDEENETGTISRNPAGGYTLQIGGKKMDISAPGDGKALIIEEGLLGNKTKAEITFNNGEPTGFNVTVLTNPGTPQIVDRVADRELQALATGKSVAPPEAETPAGVREDDQELGTETAQNPEPERELTPTPQLDIPAPQPELDIKTAPAVTVTIPR
ncbi:MAG: hypothetical protein LBK68_05805 [Candidatus Margulisbacteria bacterium]|jgi:DNA repair exonuclease SbcCD ATPase subunit|nr:hypothetical protein [Candidatus Margulisiibacteriota bacterium]